MAPAWRTPAIRISASAATCCTGVAGPIASVSGTQGESQGSSPAACSASDRSQYSAVVRGCPVSAHSHAKNPATVVAPAEQAVSRTRRVCAAPGERGSARRG